MSRGWTELLRSLGDSLIGVAGAEVEALKGDLRASGKQFLVVLALAAAAAFFFFWVVGVGAFVLFQILTLWLPRWGAAMIVFALFLSLALILALVTRQRLRALEPPVETVRRRVDDHVDWWESQVLLGKGQNRDRVEAESSGEQTGIPDES